MHKRSPEFFLVDILVAIDKIKRKTSNISFNNFVSDEDRVDSVLRSLEIIGEAVGLLLKSYDVLSGTDVPWRRIVNLRNVLIHFYFGIDMEEVFGIAQNKVPVLEEDIWKIVKTKSDKQQFLQALEDTKADLQDFFRNDSVKYLEKIKDKLSQ
jgi:uncharacterized protein with HEPN domain